MCPNDESLAEVLYDGLLNPLYYPSLGRWEDLLRIDTVEICDISEDITNDATITLNRNAYIPVEYYNSDDYNYKITGTRNRINKSYAINPNTKFRHRNEQIDVIYASPQSKIVKVPDVQRILKVTQYFWRKNGVGDSIWIICFLPNHIPTR